MRERALVTSSPVPRRVVARRLWRDHAVRTVPGAYFAYPDPETGENPGERYIRVALVHDLDDAEEGLTRIAECLGA